jgi:thioredoxin reductase (NADPH)
MLPSRGLGSTHLIPPRSPWARHLALVPSVTGALFADKEAVVIGRGDHGLESSLYLSDLCPRVTVLHRRSELRAADVLRRGIYARPNVDLVLGHVVDAFIGDTKLEEVAVRDVANGVELSISTNGAFLCIGLVPATDAFAHALKLDDDRPIIVDLTLATSAPGVFAAGIARSQSPDQLITALADGVTAARSVCRQLRGPSA